MQFRSRRSMREQLGNHVVRPSSRCTPHTLSLWALDIAEVLCLARFSPPTSLSLSQKQTTVGRRGPVGMESAEVSACQQTGNQNLIIIEMLRLWHFAGFGLVFASKFRMVAATTIKALPRRTSTFTYLAQNWITCGVTCNCSRRLSICN